MMIFPLIFFALNLFVFFFKFKQNLHITTFSGPYIFHLAEKFQQKNLIKKKDKIN